MTPWDEDLTLKMLMTVATFTMTRQQQQVIDVGNDDGGLDISTTIGAAVVMDGDVIIV